MSIRTVSLHAFLQDLEWLFTVINTHTDSIGWSVSAHHLRIPKIPRQVGAMVMPYYLAADLKAVFDFSVGKRELAPDFVEDVVNTVLEVLFLNALQRVQGMEPQPDWDSLGEKPLGIVLLAALGRAKILFDEPLEPRELKALTGLTPKKAQRQGLHTEIENGKEVYPPEQVAALLKRLDDDV